MDEIKGKGLIVRDVPEDVLAAIDEIAGRANKSREAFLRDHLADLAKAGAVPKLAFGQGLRAFTPTGGKAQLRQLTESVSGGASNLSQQEMDAFQRAKLLADPRNGGDWAKTRATLEAAGFEVFWV